MRSFRIVLALVMLFASLLWLVLGTSAPVYAVISEKAQIIPSSIQSCLGATVVWIIATLLFGRIADSNRNADGFPCHGDIFRPYGACGIAHYIPGLHYVGYCQSAHQERDDICEKDGIAYFFSVPSARPWDACIPRHWFILP